MEKARTEKQSVTFDELSMERSTSFVTALQELKNLRPQLYSAAEYCEKSYLNSEQKQMVLDNLKDYAVRALVNAIDHLGTVAYKLSDILEQQASEISSIDLKLACLNQQLLTCQTYTDQEGFRQQQLLAIIPRHHKHYTLPSASVAKTLCWHLASETKSTLKGSPRGIMSIEDSKMNGKVSGELKSLDARGKPRMKSTPATRVAMQTLGVQRRDALEGSKSSTPHKSLETPTTKKETVPPPVRSKSMISAFFVKQKAPNLRTSA
ncbi:UNVERIFIED_CONTAM: protein ABIL1 [Sesamum angustifolium]|uniref:Protein ABIL1 n=1 Tax=Sesamum angustifolium TaxID=2727405 RepID=A0AAW2RGV3_9LAMI